MPLSKSPRPLARRLLTRRRRGIGALLLVLGVTMVIFILAMSLGGRGQGVTSLVQRTALELRGESLARAANLEALRFLRRYSGIPGHPAHEFFTSPSPPQARSLSLDRLPFLRAELARWPGFSLETPVEIHALRRLPLTLQAEERNDYELHGMFRILSRIAGPKGSRSVLLREYPHRNLLTAPPRPFDKVTLFLGDAKVLLTRGAWKQSANQTMSGATNLRGLLRLQLQEVAQAFETSASELARVAEDQESSQAASLLKKASQDLVRESQALRDLTTDLAGRAAASPDLFPEDLSLLSREARVDLGALHLPLLLRPFLEAWDPGSEGGNQAFEDTRIRIREALGRSKSDQASIQKDLQEAIRLAQELAQRGQELDTALLGVLETYRQFQASWVLLEGEERQKILDHARQLHHREQRWRADFTFEGSGAAERASAFLSRRPPPSGVVYISDPEAPVLLHLEETQGRLMVISRGPMRISSARVQDPQRDAIILVGYDEFEVAGPIQASLVSLGGGYSSRGDSFEGNLFLDSLPNSDSLDGLLRGTLTFQESLLSGPREGAPRPPPTAAAIHVAIGPHPLFWRMSR